MSALFCNFNRNSTCATCLSQNGILISVRDSQVCMVFYSEFNLMLTDRVCPACHDFIQRMAAFKSRAQQAQAWLQNMATFQPQKLLYVSLLTPGLNVMAPVTDTTDRLTPDINPEPDIHQEFKVELKYNEVGSNHLDLVSGNIHQQSHSTPGSINSDMVIRPETEDNADTHGYLLRNMVPCSNQLQQTHSTPVTTGPSDSAILIKPENYDNCNNNSEAFSLENMVPCRTLQQSHCGDFALGPSMPVTNPVSECNGNNNVKIEDYENRLHHNVIPCSNNQEANNLEATVTSKPSLRIIKPEAVESRDSGVADVAHERSTNSVGITVFTHQKVKPIEAPAVNNKRKTPATVQPQPDYICTETILTEGEMTQWRLLKPHTEFYARGVASGRCEICIDPFDYRVHMRAHVKMHTEIDRLNESSPARYGGAGAGRLRERSRKGNAQSALYRTTHEDSFQRSVYTSSDVISRTQVYGDLVCHICQQRTIDKPAMEVHKKWHYRLLKCRYCPFVWDNVNTLRHHCQEMHSIPQVLWDCDRCERQFTTLQLWRRHRRNHKRAKCPVCELSLRVQGVKRHMEQHHTRLALKKCEECGKEIRGEQRLRYHMRKHRGEVDKPVYCTECNVQCRNRMTYRAHLKSSKHLGKDDYRFECNDCGKKFPTISQLRVHLDVHNDTEYPCDKCEKVFNTRQSRRRHILLVHERKARPELICDLCGKVYPTKGCLVDHINSHTGARPYACKICGDTFGYKSALYLHGRFKHKIQKKKKDTKKTKDTKKIKDTKINRHTKKIGDSKKDKDT